jgi:class 3 adenylate cyclase/tetratricopeptide (TPR) repeat protein
MDLTSWLRSLGLERFEGVFRDNEIDAEVLPDLTEADLEKLHVPLGPRKRILRAISDLKNLEKARSAVPEKDTAERRQLTVMFCDLVGSTELSARLDPEDMRQVIRVYQDAASSVIARYDGFIAKFMGDGILAYFGFPRAHEDDAERAVYAALEIVNGISELETCALQVLKVRIGIATGLVVVGDIVGQGSAQEQAVVGETPNLAARLQALAEPNNVVIALSTRRLVGNRFKVRDMGHHELKGLAQPISAWSVEGISLSESRFEAAHGPHLVGIVGRELETALVIERQRDAWQGQGRVVLISGEPGIGKSRLCAWLGQTLAGEQYTRLQYQCSPFHRDSALYPFIKQIERAAKIASDESAEHKLDKLEAVLRLATPLENGIVPLFASLLSISPGTRYPPLGLSPVQQRRKTISALLDQMEGLALQKPLLVVFEDVQWADATTLEALDLAVERIRRLPVLLLITFRPEFEPAWNGLPHVESLKIGRLERYDVEILVDRLTGSRKLPTDLIQQIVAKTDGVPLFIEELTRNILESGLLIEDGNSFRLSSPLPPLAIPSTLQDSLMARLDRLAPVKEVAQIAAAIGREFPYALLRTVFGGAEEVLKTALEQLEKAELVFQRGVATDLRYCFKHALVQDTAYETLLKSRRQVLHRRIADTLRDKFVAIAAAEPELVAHHLTEAGSSEEAVEWWTKAGRLALQRSAFVEAISHFGRAVDLSDRLAEMAHVQPSSTARLRLQIAYATANLHARGPGAAATTAAFTRAREFAATAEPIPERLSAYYGLWVSYIVRGEPAQAMLVTDSMLSDFQNNSGSQDYSLIERAIGMARYATGQYQDSRRHLEQSICSYDEERDCRSYLRFGVDTGVASKCFLAITMWPLGDVTEARSLSEDAIELARRINHVPTFAYAHGSIALLHILRDDFRSALLHSKATLELSQEHGMPLYESWSHAFRGWARWRGGDEAAGIEEMRSGIQLMVGQGRFTFAHLARAFLAQAEAACGYHDDALENIAAGLLDVKDTGQNAFASTLHCTEGEILSTREPSNPAPAERAFLSAIEIAREQKTRSFELRAALGLAKLYQRTCRAAYARSVLAPALQGLSPSADFPDVAEARSHLSMLKE